MAIAWGPEQPHGSRTHKVGPAGIMDLSKLVLVSFSPHNLIAIWYTTLFSQQRENLLVSGYAMSSSLGRNYTFVYSPESVYSLVEVRIFESNQPRAVRKHSLWNYIAWALCCGGWGWEWRETQVLYGFCRKLFCKLPLLQMVFHLKV